MLTIAKLAADLALAVKTLPRWDREGRLKAERIGTGRRVYCKAAALDCLLQGSPRAGTRTDVAYCRVSWRLRHGAWPWRKRGQKSWTARPGQGRSHARGHGASTGTRECVGKCRGWTANL